jgi:hypothetical protein
MNYWIFASSTSALRAGGGAPRAALGYELKILA